MSSTEEVQLVVPEGYTSTIADESDRPSGCACTLFAAVDSNPAISRGFGAVAVQAIATGVYLLSFDRDISGGAYVATIGSVSFLQVLANPGEITVMSAAGVGLPAALYVATYSSNGTFRASEFFVAVFLKP